MKINVRIKRTTRQYIIVAFICIVIIGGASFFTTILITKQVKVEYNTLLTAAREELKENQREVYVAIDDIPAGEVITENQIRKAIVYSSQPQNSYISVNEVGQQALIDIPKDTQITAAMLIDDMVSDELREVEYQIITVNTNIVSNDTIDIRIVFPNGESLVVLSKKMIKGITEGSLMCYLWLDSEEILRMSAAIVDAALYPGTQLVTTKYIEPSIQEASEITYIPSLAILELLETDPNVLERSSQQLNREVRKALENRLASSMATDVAEINWDINPNRSKEKETEGIPGEGEEASSVKSNIQKENQPTDEVRELGDKETNDYFYYAQEQALKEGEMEYGE